MKRFVLAIALACALTGTTLAGDIHTAGEPTPGEIHSTDSSTRGDIASTGDPSAGDTPSTDLAVVLTILDLVF